MSEILKVIPDIHGYTEAFDGGVEVGGEIAEVQVGKEIRHYRFGCIFTIGDCPLREGIRRKNCDARNFQGKGRNAVKWIPPKIAVGCARTGDILVNPPGNIKKLHDL